MSYLRPARNRNLHAQATYADLGMQECRNRVYESPMCESGTPTVAHGTD